MWTPLPAAPTMQSERHFRFKYSFRQTPKYGCGTHADAKTSLLERRRWQCSATAFPSFGIIQSVCPCRECIKDNGRQSQPSHKPKG